MRLPRRSRQVALGLCLVLAAAGPGAATSRIPAAAGAGAGDPLAELCRQSPGSGAGAAARRLVAALPPAALERRLDDSPDLAAVALPLLGGALAGAGEPWARELAGYLAAAARARAERLAPRSDAGAAEVRALAALLVVDPQLFAGDAAFRQRVLASFPATFGPRSPPALRSAVLDVLGQLPGLDFTDDERLAVAWGVAHRSSASRRFDLAAGAGGTGIATGAAAVGSELRFSSDDDPIAASIYSLPSWYFSAAVADRLLAAVHAAAPRRRLIVLADLAQRRALQRLVARWQRQGGADAQAPSGPVVELLDTWGRRYSPWPRDPMSLVFDGGGALAVLVRPNAQTGREEDQHLGPALVDMLPDGLDRAWGGGAAGVRWTVAPVPFHNGQVLMTRQAAWISLHTLEPRILEILGIDRVPVGSFATAPGVARYVAAARRAAAELALVYRRPVRFAHPLPEADGPATTAAAPAAPSVPGTGTAEAAIPAAPADAELMQRLGGGAGYDLDSLLTLLPAQAGAPVALVGSIAAGRRLLAAAGEQDWAALHDEYGLASSSGALNQAPPSGGLNQAPPSGGLRAALAAAQEAPRAVGLEGFLDLVAARLAAEGFEVRRLPLLSVPTALLAGRHLGFPEFLISWNNVVLESRGGGLRAEGFASLLPSGDALAGATFAAAGCRLDLLPPLVESVIFNGGYRCASNQLRQPPAAAAPHRAAPSAPTRGARSRTR
jgi:hypothetical protein